MDDNPWQLTFRQLWDKAVAQYTAGGRSPAGFFDAAESAALADIGYTAQELYDFVEDWCRYQEPTFETAVAIAGVRRDYFLKVQQGRFTGHTISMAELPAKTAAVAGFEWLPRVIAKARAKLRGEMPAELMFGCGGDRSFFAKVKIDPAEFLRIVWAAGADDQKIIAAIQQHAAGR